jgi:hypothetical protein
MAHRFTPALALSFVIAGNSGTAQTARTPQFAERQDPAASIAAMLRSGDPREQAWGAWYASRDHMRAFLPALQDLAVQRIDGISQAEAAAVDIALDALIQMRAQPSPEIIGEVYRGRPEHALILASQITHDLPSNS